MKLNLEQMKEITLGALKIECNEAGEYCFYRFTEHQMEDVYIEIPDFYKKSKAAAGIRLDFLTDSESLSFRYTIKSGSSRKFYFFDCFVDGVLIAHEGEMEMVDKAGEVTVTLGTDKRERRVTLWLPGLSIVRLSDVTLDDGASLRRAPTDRKILVLGDSITQGYDAVYSSQSYANKLAWALNAEIVNQAIGGEIFRPAILDEELPFTPDLITVAFGTNDWSGQTAENFEKNADGFYTKLATLYPETPVFVILPIWRADWEKVTRAKPFHESREILRGLAQKHPNFRVIDGMLLTPHLPSFFSDLYLHPNDLGFEIYAQELVARMREIGF
jgi:lysophospholipase L1-like esterase